MDYFVSSNTKRYKPTDLEEVIYLLIEKIDTEEFLVLERQNDRFSENQDYMQTTLNTSDNSLFWVETRRYYSDNDNDFNHYRLKCDDTEPVIDAFTTFFNNTVNYQTWEDVTAEFK